MVFARLLPFASGSLHAAASDKSNSRLGRTWIGAARQCIEIVMSYDFILFQPESGIDPREIGGDDDGQIGPRDPSVEALKRRIADALLAHDPTLSEHIFDYDEVARLHKISVAAAYERYRYIELTDIDGGSGTQITLFDDHAAVTVPYWHDDDAAGRAQLQRVWSYMDVLCGVSGYEVFDLQLDRVITRSAFEVASASYSKASERIRSIIAPPQRKRPWWRFW
jgi:hypothetical protein